MRETDPKRLLKVERLQASLKTTIRDNIYRDWHGEWKGLTIVNHAKSFYGGPNPGKAKFVYKLGRLELGRFIRIVTGHNNLSRLCCFCGVFVETIIHLMAVPGPV